MAGYLVPTGSSQSPVSIHAPRPNILALAALAAAV